MSLSKPPLRGGNPGRRRALVTIGSTLAAFALKPVRATEYLSPEEARASMFPGKTFALQLVQINAAQKKAIEAASKTRVRETTLRASRSDDGEWFILDQVIGKHEFIDVAVGLNQFGAVVGIEILTYRESYGDEVRNPRWRSQFRGKDHSTRLSLDENIKSISGATLSCQHITQGVNRLTATWAEVLSKL